MTQAELLEIINTDEYGLLESPQLTEDEQAIVDAFVPFILKHI